MFIFLELWFLLQDVALVLPACYCVRNMLHAAVTLQGFLPQLFDHILTETLSSQCQTVIKQCFSLPRLGSCQLSVLTHESMFYSLVSLSLENKRGDITLGDFLMHNYKGYPVTAMLKCSWNESLPNKNVLSCK